MVDKIIIISKHICKQLIIGQHSWKINTIESSCEMIIILI